MKLKDFKVGQEVYLKTIGHPLDCWKTEWYHVATVTNVGRKYVSVQIGTKPNQHAITYRFDSTNSFRQDTKYCSDYMLFLSKQDIFDYWQRRYLLREIRTYIAIHERSMPIDLLNNVAAAMNIPVDAWKAERRNETGDDLD